MRLKNKVAIVTGASSGIGLAIGKLFATEGAKVVFSDINEINPNEIEKFKENAVFVKTDVSNPEEVSDLISQTDKMFGKINIMVNNAGIGFFKSINDLKDDQWKKTISVNLSGVMYGIRESSKYMIKNKISGSVINTSSILGKVGFESCAAYCASKGGVIQLTRASALDLAKYKIRVNSVAPGFTKTNMTKPSLSDPEFKKMIIDSTPMNKIGEVENIANAVLYLASDESKFVTGEVISVDGGWLAR